MLRLDGVSVRFEVEQARDADARKTGLMWRDRLAPYNGMLFDFHRMHVVNMWMKDTLIPLDMLFATASGELVQIARNVRPHSLSLISSVVPARYVLEINAGEAKKLELNVGDRLLVHNVQNSTHAR